MLEFWVLLVILVLVGIIVLCYTIISPRTVAIVRDLRTGELSEREPGLAFIPPWCEKYAILDCRPEVATLPLDVITKEGQPYIVGLYRASYIDALEKEVDKLREDQRGIRVATKLPAQEKEKLDREIDDLVKRVSQAAVEKYFALLTVGDIETGTFPSEEEIKEEKRRAFSKVTKPGAPEATMVISPDSPRFKMPFHEGIERVSGEITTLENAIGEIDKTTDMDGEQKKKREGLVQALINKRKLKARMEKELRDIPDGLMAQLSWYISVYADHTLTEFGIGCDLRILNILPPGQLVNMRLAKDVVQAEIAKVEKEAQLQDKRAEIIKKFQEKTDVSSSVIYLGNLALEGLRGILESLKKKEEHGGEKK